MNYSVEGFDHIFVALPFSSGSKTNPLAGILLSLPPLGYADLSKKVLTQLLLYGNKNCPNDVDSNILDLTLQFIDETGWLDEAHFNLSYKPRSH